MAPPRAKLTRRQREQRTQAEAHPVTWLVRQIVPEMGGSAEASPSVWLEELVARATDHARQAQEWPKCPAQLGRVFSEVAPGLSLLGVVLSHRRTGPQGRLWRAETPERAQARRHLRAQEQERRQAQEIRERGHKAHLRATLRLSRELRKRAERKKR